MHTYPMIACSNQHKLDYKKILRHILTKMHSYGFNQDSMAFEKKLLSYFGILLTFTCFTNGIGTMKLPTSISPIDLERQRPPGQHLKGPICTLHIINAS
jgi:hypothetical protein